MDGRIPARTSRLIGAILAATFALAVMAGAASAESEVIYNNLPSPTPGNVVSEAFEATQTAQFGGAVEFTGTNRKGGMLSIGMSSWACQKGSWTGTPECVTEPGAKFEWPITRQRQRRGSARRSRSARRDRDQDREAPLQPATRNRAVATTTR